MNLEQLFLSLLNRSLAACWLVLGIIILRPFLRRVSRSLCCALWGLVAFRLLCPFSVRSVLSLIPSVETVPTDLASATTILDGLLPVGSQTGDALTSSPSDVPATAPAALTLLQVLTWIWLIGVAMLLLYAFASSLRIYRCVRESVRQEDGYWMCDRVDFPFVIGFFRPRIILPFEVDRQDLPYILAHERAHLARHDHWRKPIAFLLLSVFWFQPVFWIAYHLLCRDAEFACDGRALRSLGIDKENKAGYAMALLKSCPRRSHAAKLTGPLAFGGLQIKRRVDSVLTYKRPTTVRMFAALLVCAVLAVCFLTDPKVDAEAFVELSVDRVDTVAPAPEGSTDEVKEPTVVPSGGAAEAQDMSLDEWMQAYGQQYPEGERELYYILCHFDKRHVCDEPSGVHTLLCENIGTEDGSVTIYVKDHDDFGSPEVITIPLSAGEKTVLTFDHCFSHAVIAASYGDVSVDRSWTVPLFS